MNLALNARVAMPQGGILDITLYSDVDATVPNREWIVLAVKDSGTGISKVILSRIFDPFFTTKKIGKGNGLGLPQVKGVIEQHGGRVEVKSTAGKGTTFEIWLPSIEIQSPAPTKADPSIVKTTLDGHGEWILLVEDNQKVLHAVTESLDHLNYQILVATNAEEAFNQHSRYRDKIRLLISDMVMPDKNGIDLVEKIRKLTPDLPIILMTGYPLEQVERRSKIDNIIWFQMPIRFDELADAVAKALSNINRSRP